jgi:predicted dehydrogenase
MKAGQKFAEELNVKACLTDYRQIIEEVDGVIIAAPTQMHYPISIEFLSVVYTCCRKPLAESADKAKEDGGTGS